MKYIDPSEKVQKQLPSEQVVKNYGRSSKLLLAEKDIPDLHFDIKDKKEKGDSSEKTEVMEIMDVNTGGMTPLNIDCREHSRNSLENAAGEELQLVSEQRSLKRTFSRDTHLQHSKCREHSQNSRIKQPGIVEGPASDEDAEHTAASSDFSKHSQNSLSKSEPNVDPGQAKATFGDHDGQCLGTVSEFQELSPNSRVETEGSEGRQKKQHTKPVCVSEPSEYSRDSLDVGNNVSVPSFSWFKSMSQIVGLTATWQSKVEGNPTAAGTTSNDKVNTNPVHTEFNFFL